MVHAIDNGEYLPKTEGEIELILTSWGREFFRTMEKIIKWTLLSLGIHASDYFL